MQQGKLIRKLPPEIHNKIAAGEVVQRPGSVIKELLDNAIDASASHIQIFIENAGRTLLQLIDNGSGIAKEDIPLCFERHATSKIQDVDDLFRIRSLGFRGEAMASIAAIAQVQLKTKTDDEATGFEYEIWGGHERTFQPCAFERGTSISVRNLFYNVPARRAFLKTDTTELRHILTIIQQAALANCDIQFDVYADASEMYRLPVQSLEERVSSLFGKQYKASLIPFYEETTFIKLSGVLIDPKLTKKHRGEQFLFVNGRPFSHRYIQFVVGEVYKPLVDSGEYPFYALFFELDPSEVDVNVHPSKMEVKFEDEKSVISFTRSVIRKALNERFAITPDTFSSSESGFLPPQERYSTGTPIAFFQSDSDFHSSGKPFNHPVSSRINANQPNAYELGNQLYRPDHLFTETNSQNEENRATKHSKSDYVSDRGYWQLHDQFVVSQTRTGMCIIDQHLAHCRILFEKALENLDSGLPSSQQLLFPQQVEFSATDFQLLKEILPQMVSLGFSLQLFSGFSVMISGVPSEVRVGDEVDVLRNLIEQVFEMRSDKKLSIKEKVALALARRTAIPRGKKLSQLEMEKLVDELFACEQPILDPRGKPTIQYISLDEIRLKFR